MTDGAAGHQPTPGLRPGAGLLAGLLLLDILLNLPLLVPTAPVRSLLAPSIDLLVLVAGAMGIAQAGLSVQRGLRAGFAVLTAALLACEALLRFGGDAGGRLFGSGPETAAVSWVVCGLLAVFAAAAAFVLSGLTVRGLRGPLARSLVLLAVSLAVVLQVVSGRRVFTPSVIPRLISLIG